MPLLETTDLGELTQPRGTLVETGEWYVLTSAGLFLTVPANKVSWDAWWALGRTFATTAASFKFWVADWLRVGCFVFGEKFAQAQELFPWWDEQTLMNIQRVGNRIPPSRRRAEHLPFEYHEAVAAAVPAAQVELLERAVNDPSITREVLRDMVDARRQDTPEKAEIEFRARPIRRAMSAVDACLPRLAGEPKKLVHEAGDHLREALRIVEAPGRKPK